MLPSKIICKAKIVVVTGYTATGKTRLAVQLARQFDGEIINADSRQVYRGLDIGTGKDLAEYEGENGRVASHLIDINKPCQFFDLYTFKKLAIEAIADVHKRGKLAIVCGGTALYIDALLNDYQFSGEKFSKDFQMKFSSYSYDALLEYFAKHYPNREKDFDLSQKQRVIRAIEIIETGEEKKPSHSFQGEALVCAPFYERKIVYEKIGLRLKERWSDLLQEVEDLKKSDLIDSQRLDALGLEYRYANDILEGRLSEENGYELLFQAIRKFAKRQGTWFRKLEKSYININWCVDGSEVTNLVKNFLGR